MTPDHVNLFSEIEIKYKTIARECESVDVNDRETSDGCHDSLPSCGPIRNLATSAFSDYDLGTLDFKGNVCYGGNLYQETGAANFAVVSLPLILLTVCYFLIF